MQDLLETLLAEAHESISLARESTLRDYKFPPVDKLIKVAIGMRRSGKSTFLYQTINKLLDSGVDYQQILFINFEDDRLLPMSAKEMGQLLDSFYTLYPENHDRICYLFLDELQNIEDWHLVVRRFFDSKKVQIYLSGSSAKMLSKEINTSLRGRSIATEIYPFSFSEYLTSKKVSLSSGPFGQKTYDVMQKHLLEYFGVGGFPAVQDMQENEWRETLQSYIDTVILRDIIERHKVSNVVVLKYLTTTLLKNAAAPFTVNKFYNDIKSMGMKCSKDLIYQYMIYLNDVFLVHALPVYSESIRASQYSPKKIYANDLGLINALTIGSNDQYGKLFENLVFLDLKRQKKDVFYYNTKDGFEIDFIAQTNKGEKEAIQVVWDMSDTKTHDREKRALVYAEKELGIKGRIITPKEYLRDVVKKQRG